MDNLIPPPYEQALTYVTINSSFTGELELFPAEWGLSCSSSVMPIPPKASITRILRGCLLDELYEEAQEDLPIFNCT